MHMAQTSEMTRLIALLDKRIRRLQEARALLVEDGGETVRVPKHTSRPERRTAELASNANGSGRGKRKAQLEKFLKQHGPATRSEVVAGSGVPDGTLGYLATKHPDVFMQKDGKWALVEVKSK